MTTTEHIELTGTYLLEPTHTRLGFVARQAWVSRVRGEFGAFEGRAHLDFTAPERSRVDVTVDAASINTRNARRDEHLSSSFFNVADHPHITFRSTEVQRLADDRFQVAGELGIKGHTKPIVIDFAYTGVDDADGTSLARFTGHATLDRRDWGVAWNAALEGGGAFVSNAITLELDVGAARAAAGH